MRYFSELGKKRLGPNTMAAIHRDRLFTNTTTAEGAMGQMHSTLNAVEDAFSGVPKAANPGLKPDGTMYPAQPDRIVTGADGTMSATSLKQVTNYGPNGSFPVADLATGAVLYHKPGGG